MAVGPIANPAVSAPEALTAHVLEGAVRAANTAMAAAALNVPADSSASSLVNLANADLTRLSTVLDQPHDPSAGTQVEGLVRDASAAIAQGNTLEAVGALNQVAALDPKTIEVLRTDPAFAPIRPEIDHLLNHLTPLARMKAEELMGRAESGLEEGALKTGSDMPAKADALMQAAHKSFDAGGYSNFVRSADLAQTVIDNYAPWMIAYKEGTLLETRVSSSNEVILKKALQSNIQASWNIVRERAPLTVKRLWVKAPLLVLLLGWLLLGLLVGATAAIMRNPGPDSASGSFLDLFFDGWALGFLALIGFGFYARVRRPRF